MKNFFRSDWTFCLRLARLARPFLRSSSSSRLSCGGHRLRLACTGPEHLAFGPLLDRALAAASHVLGVLRRRDLAPLSADECHALLLRLHPGNFGFPLRFLLLQPSQLGQPLLGSHVPGGHESLELSRLLRRRSLGHVLQDRVWVRVRDHRQHGCVQLAGCGIVLGRAPSEILLIQLGRRQQGAQLFAPGVGQEIV